MRFSRLLTMLNLLFSMGPLCFSQTVDVQYINPNIATEDFYKFMRFGSPSSYSAGLMWNIGHDDFGDGDDFSIFTYGNRDITLRTGTGNVIVFPTSGGNMGIGTKSPDEKLTVKGKIHAREVRVDLTGAVAPDYVFEEGYELRPLTEVRAYIKKEGHLPDIPSAEEMESNGINLKEMNLRLLEKIEELTLYTIQQQESLEESKKRRQALMELVERQVKRMGRLAERLDGLEGRD